MSKNPEYKLNDAEYRELDQKIKKLASSGSFDKISESVAEFVTRRIERYQSAKVRR